MRSSDSGGSSGGVSGDGNRVGNMQGCEAQSVGGEGPSHVGGKLQNIVAVFIHSPQSVVPLWAFRLPQRVDGERGEGVEWPPPTERRDRAEDKSRLSKPAEAEGGEAGGSTLGAVELSGCCFLSYRVQRPGAKSGEGRWWD